MENFKDAEIVPGGEWKVGFVKDIIEVENDKMVVENFTENELHVAMKLDHALNHRHHLFVCLTLFPFW